jgi:hypothetical protein
MLKSGFRFWTNLSLGVQASHASALPMVGYLLELFCEGTLARVTMMIRQPSSVEFQQVLPPILG